MFLKSKHLPMLKNSSNKLKLFFSTSFFVCFFSCSQISKEKKHISSAKYAEPLLDSAKKNDFKSLLIMDTIGCHNMTSGRSLLKSILLEKAVINVDNNSIFLKTPEYSRLWCCNIPEFLKEYNGDTIMINAKVYYILGNESMKGYPTMIESIRLKSLKKNKCWW